MIRNHLLSVNFDISTTFRENIKKKTNKEDEGIELETINKIIKENEFIDYIQCIDEGANNLYLKEKLYVLNKDELIKVIRTTPHLYFNEDKNVFINLKLIRTIEKDENKNLRFSYTKGHGVEFLDTKFKSMDEFFNIVENLDTKTIAKTDFNRFFIKYFRRKTEKYIHKSLFYAENKYLEENNRFSLINILSVSLFYFIPFIPYVGINKYSLWIFPGTTFIILGLFIKRYNIKKQILDMY